MKRLFFLSIYERIDKRQCFIFIYLYQYCALNSKW